MQNLLNSLSQLLILNCPFLHLASSSNLYDKVPESDLIVEFGEEEGGLPPNGIQTGNLIHKRVLVLNGGTVQSLNVAHLTGQQQSLLRFAVSALGFTFHSMALANLSVQRKAFSQSVMDSDLNSLSVHTSEDTRILVSTSRMSTFRSQVTPKIIPWPQSTLINTKSVYDYSYPIVMPSGGYNEVISFRYFNSFVYSDPKFTVANNCLYFDFLCDMQSANRTIIYQ